MSNLAIVFFGLFMALSGFVTGLVFGRLSGEAKGYRDCVADTKRIESEVDDVLGKLHDAIKLPTKREGR